jgi:hypothetical protein
MKQRDGSKFVGLGSFVALSLLGGCVLSEPEEQTGEVDQAIITCPGWWCGSNSPVIDNRGFHELNEDGLPEPEHGFRLVDYRKNGASYALDVRNGKLTGIGSPSVGTISGQSLLGSYMIVKNGGLTYAIAVFGVTPVDYWADNGAVPKKQVESYLLNWTAVDANGDFFPYMRWQNVCSNPPSETAESTLHMNANNTLLFEGDRVEAATKRDNAVDTTGKWFNFGCAGHALAKMYLTGHVEAAKVDGYDTTLDERTTILKMFSGDYCGDGTPFTVAGQKLGWMDHRGWMTYDPQNPPLSIEARWYAGGARCLTVPRVAANPTTLSTQVFPGNIKSYIDMRCSIPVCSPLNPFDLARFHLVSGNPQ